MHCPHSPARPRVAHAILALLILCPAPGASMLTAQERVVEGDEWCRDRDRGSSRPTACEVRERILPAGRGTIEVDARPNGGIRVEAWDSDEISVRARVHAQADADAEAADLLRRIDVTVDGRKIGVAGPKTSGDRSWSVSFRLLVPRASDLDLHSTNGGIRIRDVAGTVRFRTTNGGIHLEGVGGDVRGSTTNGGLRVALTGNAWRGRGLDVKTTNGGVELSIPEGYAAHLETGTVNGGLEIDFPVTVQGRIDRRLSIDLGGGGATVRAVTTNGGVSIVGS